MDESSPAATVSWWQRLMLPVRSIPDRAGSIRSIALLRGAAVVLVLWDHLVGQGAAMQGRSWIPLDIVRNWVSGPLAIIQDFGFLGVTLFFLLSGYIISEVAVRESRRDFAVKRLLRIYPALIVSILVIVALDELRPAFDLPQTGFGRAQSLWAMTLLNYVRAAHAPVNGVAWSLIIEVLFYALVFGVLTQLRRRPLLAFGIEAAVVAGIVLSARQFPVDSLQANWFLLSVSVSYIPLLLMGQVVWMWRSRRVSPRLALVSMTVCWVLFVLGMRRVNPSFLPAANSYGVSAGFALGIFTAAVVFEHRVRLPRWIGAVSVVSYSVYLLHGAVAYFVLDVLAQHSVPFSLQLVAALVAVALVSVASWRLIELPAQQWSRSLTRRGRRPDVNASEGEVTSQQRVPPSNPT